MLATIYFSGNNLVIFLDRMHQNHNILTKHIYKQINNRQQDNLQHQTVKNYKLTITVTVPRFPRNRKTHTEIFFFPPPFWML